MTNEELRARLSTVVEDTIVLPDTGSNNTSTLHMTAEKVMESYQNANKWLDIIKEVLLMDIGCVFFSNYVHNLAHSMPVRFDKFGDILHTVDMKVPYPATGNIPNTPSDINGCFTMIFEIIKGISTSLREFIKITQDTEYHALACSTEELLIDIERENTNLFRMKRAYDICGDAIKFDKYVAHYVSNLGNLID